MKRVRQSFILASGAIIALSLWEGPVTIGAIQNERDAATLYEKNCATCHGKDGRARNLRGRHVHAQDLTDSAWQDQVSDERIFNSISNGKRRMPAFGKKLSDREIDALVNYVRGLKK